MVDFDSICQGEPALDVGQFLAYLKIACMESATAQAGLLAERWSDLFWRAYVAASGHRVDAGRLGDRTAVYTVASLLRRAVRSWQKFKPARIEAALAALEDAMTRLP